MKPHHWTLRHWIVAGITIIVLVVVIIGSWTFYDAWDAGVLPWQPDPTRIAITPFADLPTVVATPDQ